MSGVAENSPSSSQGRRSEDSPGYRGISISGDARDSPGITLSPPLQSVSTHGLRLAQRDQALQQAYTNKYLSRSSSTDLQAGAEAVAHSAAALRLSTSMSGSPSVRPASIILSPNPDGPPLLNVIRVFAGENIRSDASFKTALINETTSSSDLIRQAMQRFHLHNAKLPGVEAGYYLTIKDVIGQEMELMGSEKALAAFEEAVERWSEDNNEARGLDDIAPTVKRSSVSSISSVISLSSHPAIAKLGMNDFSDDSAVKIYLNKRRPGSVQMIQGSLPELASEFSSYNSQLSTVQEASPETKNSEWSSTTPGTPPGRYIGSDATVTPPTPHARYDPSLSVDTNAQIQNSPERFSSPSSRFTIQLVMHSSDLPDGSIFDPTSDTIIPRSLMKERQASSSSSPNTVRKRLFTLPRNATVVEAIEQGLKRFGIPEGVVAGGDNIEDRGNRRNLAHIQYTLFASNGGEG